MTRIYSIFLFICSSLKFFISFLKKSCENEAKFLAKNLSFLFRSYLKDSKTYYENYDL
jgi:hypothetical protein